MIISDDDVAMGFPLGLFLANVFMVKLERTIIPSLCDKIKLWKCYFGDMITCVKNDKIKNVMSLLK